ncbi:MAG: GlsB/YeaQ/YmgE family stress response membrane protein [Gemmatimonadetes bacterium]|nr:MAG: GlsB/YeaQ/YmgE family stress response membrane protein [Gemmatimonadota bacterium]
MSIFAWIVVGTIGGFIGSLVVNKRGQGILGDLFFGVIGAVVAGWIFNAFGHPAVTGINPDSILASAAGTILVLVAYHVLRSSPARA